MNAATRLAADDDKFSSMARQVGKWMDQVLGPGFRQYSPDDTWTPAVNFCEGDDSYCIVVDLAGMKADEIDLRTEGRKLTLAGFRPVPRAPGPWEKRQMRHMEIDHGSFCRTIELPADSDIDAVEANYKGGFLWIVIPKNS